MDIKSVIVTRTIQYDPESYISFCNEHHMTPTQEQFLDFIKEWFDDDFQGGLGNETITILEE